MNDSEDDDYTSEQYEILLTKLLENKTNKSLLQISIIKASEILTLLLCKILF